MIGAVNGPAHMHAELVVLSNIVVASETASFQDAPHFANGVVPGDGVHIVWPMLLGPTRGSYFLLTNEIIDARQALELGVSTRWCRSIRSMPAPGRSPSRLPRSRSWRALSRERCSAMR